MLTASKSVRLLLALLGVKDTSNGTDADPEIFEINCSCET